MKIKLLVTPQHYPSMNPGEFFEVSHNPEDHLGGGIVAASRLSKDGDKRLAIFRPNEYEEIKNARTSGSK